MKKINQGDQVQIISGDFKGQKGKVLKLLSKSKSERSKTIITHAIVENINQVERRRKGLPGQAGKVNTIVKPISISNLAILDPEKNKPTRVTIKISKDGTKQRIAVKSKKQI